MAILQMLAVGLLVAVCALFSAWRLLSVRMRLRLLQSLRVTSDPAADGWLARLHRRTLAGAGGGCGSCSNATGVNAPVAPASRKAAALRR